jgi:hypothetical protein
MRRPGLLALIAFVITVAGCGQAPQVFLSPTGRTSAPLCWPVGANIRCTVYWAGGSRDATESVQWIVGDSWSASYARSSVAVVAAPGLIRPVSRGIIAIHVPQIGPAYDTAAPHEYAVDPNAAPIPLAPFLQGAVYETDGRTPIADVRVDILDGPDAGKFDQTKVDRSDGTTSGFYNLYHLRMGVAFTMRASKSGYLPSTVTLPGFFDDASGVPTSVGTYLIFHLQRVPS